MKPNVKLGAKNPKMAIYGHVLSLIGSLIASIFGILALITLNFGGIIGILAGIFILLVEMSYIEISFLKDAMMRGIVWIVLAVVSGAGGFLTGVVILIGGILYIVYAL